MEYICKFCGKLCKNANSLRNHERLCKLNPEHQVSSWVKFNKEREHAWNKGLTKETDERVKKQAETFSSNIKKGITKQYDHSLIWTEERRKEQSERKKKLYAEHPEKHPNVKLAGNHGKMTYPEQLAFDWLNEHSIKNEHNYHFVSEQFNRYVDFYLPDLNVFIEIDGEYWHKDKQKDIDKDADAAKYGIKTIRIKPKLNVLNQLEECLNNRVYRGVEQLVAR